MSVELIAILHEVSPFLCDTRVDLTYDSYFLIRFVFDAVLCWQFAMPSWVRLMAKRQSCLRRAHMGVSKRIILLLDAVNSFVIE